MKIWQMLIFVCAAVLVGSRVHVVEAAAVGDQPARMVAVTATSYNPGEVSLNTLRAIFVMRYARWPDGTPVKVFVYADNVPEHEVFTKEVLKFFPRQLRQAWDRQVFAGLGQYPEQVSSVKEMLAKVSSTPGGVGYVSLQEVNKDVRILQIQP
ncbi:MAG: hypothetical protein CVU29_06790 [Betaproteobacteria bacterium HGW-Betaproteobacteria-22]|nr:MAG: hypothetical protein CVU29_06790 [Betaproteobacteria bacterium HGW-Betaproteobacteria-22]